MTECSGHEGFVSFLAETLRRVGPGHLPHAPGPGKFPRTRGWRPQETFESGMKKTVDWYLDNRAWWVRVMSGAYALERLGEQRNEALVA